MEENQRMRFEKNAKHGRKRNKSEGVMKEEEFTFRNNQNNHSLKKYPIQKYSYRNSKFKNERFSSKNFQETYGSPDNDNFDNSQFSNSKDYSLLQNIEKYNNTTHGDRYHEGIINQSNHLLLQKKMNTSSSFDSYPKDHIFSGCTPGRNGKKQQEEETYISGEDMKSPEEEEEEEEDEEEEESINNASDYEEERDLNFMMGDSAMESHGTGSPNNKGTMNFVNRRREKNENERNTKSGLNWYRNMSDDFIKEPVSKRNMHNRPVPLSIEVPKMDVYQDSNNDDDDDDDEDDEDVDSHRRNGHGFSHIWPHKKGNTDILKEGRMGSTFMNKSSSPMKEDSVQEMLSNEASSFHRSTQMKRSMLHTGNIKDNYRDNRRIREVENNAVPIVSHKNQKIQMSELPKTDSFDIMNQAQVSNDEEPMKPSVRTNSNISVSMHSNSYNYEEGQNSSNTSSISSDSDLMEEEYTKHPSTYYPNINNASYPNVNETVKNENLYINDKLFPKAKIEETLSVLNTLQVEIEKVCCYVKHFIEPPDQLFQTMVDVFMNQSVSLTSKIAIFYVYNHLIQELRNKYRNDMNRYTNIATAGLFIFVVPVIRYVLLHNVSEEIVSKLFRCINIWNERNVYNRYICDQLKKLQKNPNRKFELKPVQSYNPVNNILTNELSKFTPLTYILKMPIISNEVQKGLKHKTLSSLFNNPSNEILQQFKKEQIDEAHQITDRVMRLLGQEIILLDSQLMELSSLIVDNDEQMKKIQTSLKKPKYNCVK